MGNEQAGRTLFAVGVIGTIVAALCCFTPILMVLLGAVGLAAVLGWLDLVLLPALVLFLLITGYALWQRTKTSS
jgi:mercuric ion transport protein